MRHPPGPARSPNFLLLGAQKCGTSWLFEQLRAHPRVFMPAAKELEFFSYLPHLDSPGLSAYRQQFSAAGNALVVGEASPSYFWTRTGSRWAQFPPGFNPDIPASVAALLGPDLKFVLCLRDPVERALSAYCHYVAHGELAPDVPFEQALGYGGVADMGFYARHLENWLRHYPLERFIILILEQDIISAPGPSMVKIADFLGLDWRAAPAASPAAVFPGAVRRPDQDGGVTFAAPAHHPERLVPARGVSAEQLRALRGHYHADVARLGELLQRDLLTTWSYQVA